MPEENTMDVTVPNLAAPEGRKVMVIVPNGWAKGADLWEAYNLAVRVGTAYTMLYAAIVDDREMETRVNEHGQLIHDMRTPPLPLFGHTQACASNQEYH